MRLRPAFVLLGIWATAAYSQPFGIETRAQNTTLLITAPAGSATGTPAPQNLSDIPAFLAAGLEQDQSAAGILPYRPSTELWSDGAIKSSFLALPGLAQITYRDEGGWDFPDGTSLIKNFRLPIDFRDPGAGDVRVETRLLVKLAGVWRGYSYQWNEAGTDATLVGSAGTTRHFDLTETDGTPLSYDWSFPARSDCTRCHTTAANRVLGLNTALMNHDFTYPGGIADNQLRTFVHLALFDAPLPAAIDQLPASPDAKHDLSASIEDRTAAYFQANCAMCHRPGGSAPTTIDFRWGIDVSARELVGVTPSISYLGLPDPKRVDAGVPDNSVLYLRMAHRDTNQMPPLATLRVDTEAVDLVRNWIYSLDPAANVSADQDADGFITLSELLRTIQFYNSAGLHCASGTEDGYAPGPGADTTCRANTSDYAPLDWVISLSELLRVIQFYNSGGYHSCPSDGTEDGFCPGV